MGHRSLLTRSFEVDLPLEEVWRQLGRIEDWPRWAGHIRTVEHQPGEQLGPDSSGRIHLRGGAKSTFRMSEYDPYRHWAWTGPFLWLRVRYDHRFEPLAADRTRLTWIVEGDGAGVATIGRVFGAIYAGNLDQAIPRFVAWAETEGRAARS